MQEREAVQAGAESEKAGGPWPRPGCSLPGGTKEKAVLVLVWFPRRRSEEGLQDKILEMGPERWVGVC